MNATVPAASAPTLIQRPAVRATLRALNLAGGLVLAAVAFVVLGFVAAITICTGDETTGLCVHHAGLIPYVEWTTVGTAVLAPLAAGVVAFMRRQPAWLLVGAAVAGVLFLLLLQVVAGQSSALS